MIEMASFTTFLSTFAFGFAAVYLLKRGSRGIVVSGSHTAGEMKMALVVRTDLKMGKGKAAAQCAHAAVSCYKRALFDAVKYLQQWEKEGQTKVVLVTSEEKGLMTLAKEAQKEGLIAVVIHDAGHTQVKSGTATVLGIGPGPRDIIDKIVRNLKPY